MMGWYMLTTVRSGAEERRFRGARLDVLIFRLRSYLVQCRMKWGSKFHKTLMFLGQVGTFLSFQARRSSAKRSSASDLTVDKKDFASDFTPFPSPPRPVIEYGDFKWVDLQKRLG